MNRSLSAIIIFATILLICIYSSMFIVNEGEQAIITQFGKPVGKSIQTAGLNFKIPFIQEVHYFDKRILKWDGQPNEIPTNDKTFIWIDSTARWQIVDPLLFLQRVQGYNRAIVILNDLIAGAVRDFVTKNNLIEVIRSSDWKKEYTQTQEKGVNVKEEQVKIGRDQFSNIVLNSVKKLTKSYGIKMIDVLVKRINYTDTVRAKVYDRMISERKQIAQQIRSQGEADKATILGTVDKELNEIYSRANQTAEKIRGEGDAIATKIYSVYKVDPKFYQFYSMLENYKKTLGKNSSLILKTDSPLYQYFKNIRP